MTIIEKLQALLGPTANEAHRLATLTALVEMCQEEARDYCNLSEYSAKLDNAVVQMVLQRFNRMNNEGVDSTNASGIHESFHDGYTKEVMSMLQKHRRIKTFTSDNNSGVCGGAW